MSDDNSANGDGGGGRPNGDAAGAPAQPPVYHLRLMTLSGSEFDLVTPLTVNDVLLKLRSGRGDIVHFTSSDGSRSLLLKEQQIAGFGHTGGGW